MSEGDAGYMVERKTYGVNEKSEAVPDGLVVAAIDAYIAGHSGARIAVA